MGIQVLSLGNSCGKIFFFEEKLFGVVGAVFWFLLFVAFFTVFFSSNGIFWLIVYIEKYCSLTHDLDALRDIVELGQKAELYRC